jgi:hypothetical protein
LGVIPRWGRMTPSHREPNAETEEAGGEADPRPLRPEEFPVTSRGVVFIHSATSALCPHIEWALAGVLGVRISLEWTGQPAEPGTWRAELSWTGEPGTSAELASALRGWLHLRYEVTEEPSAGHEGARYSYTPQLGVFHAIAGLHGDLLVPEDRLRAAVLQAATDGSDLRLEIDKVLGKPWDDELETFRWAAEGAPVRWLHQVV